MKSVSGFSLSAMYKSIMALGICKVPFIVDTDEGGPHTVQDAGK